MRGAALVLKANEMEPSESRFWMGRAVLAMDRLDFVAAVAILDSAEHHVTPNAGMLSLKGTALNRLNRQTEAVAALSQAIVLDSTQFVAMGALALIYDQLDSVDQAVALYERAIPLSDSAAIYLNNLAYTLASRGRELERAKILAEQALAREPGNGAYHDTMGWIEFGLGHTKRAIHELKKANNLSPNSADILEHLGDAYAKKGARRKAQDFYRRSLELAPQNEALRQKIAP